MSEVQVQEAPRAASGTEPNPPGDFIWYELMTTDPDAAKDFYDAVIGWDIEPRPAGEMDYRMIRRSDGGNAGGVLRLTDDMTAHGAKPIWLGYINVADVDETIGSIERAGGKTLMKSDIPNVGRIAMVSDPQGAPFYVMTPIPPADKPDMRSDVFSADDGLGRCGWNELQTSATHASRQFYGDQFGWTSDEFMPMGEMGEYRFFDQRGTRIGAVFTPNNGQPPHWRFYFRVESIKAAKATAEQKGGTIHMGPMQVPTGAWITVGSDPQGAEFALVGGE